MLFFSQDGEFETGPTNLARGDRIIVFNGVAIPLIIRKSSKGDSMVLGPAFVPGLCFMTEEEYIARIGRTSLLSDDGGDAKAEGTFLF